MSAEPANAIPASQEVSPAGALPPEGSAAADALSWANSQETLSLPQAPHEEGRHAHLVSKPTSHRDDVVIPDYTLLKRIGAGAYGEVWLAQSVTGALRAVKIVWREDFELTKTFHREFLGIQQFEPISRGHPGLVHILHVGWNEHRGFYYCVMELADDCEAGPRIEDTQSYIPRTLGTDMKRHGRLDLHFVKEAGIFLADALHYMHNHGLTHRDIKPSNIIFVGGVCKLADIGLVAGFGERSFVGTEGFVPPEGPGTPQADIYSLGKVLYEMSSGKDRMEFPEVPHDLSDEEWPFWLDLNRVICKACAPDLKERFASGAQFAEALRHVGEPRPASLAVRTGRFAKAAIVLLFASACAGGVLAGYKSSREPERWTHTFPIPTKPIARPAQPQPPRTSKPWQSRYGQWFSFKQGRHVADLPVDYPSFNRFLDATRRSIECDIVTMKAPGNRILSVVLVPREDATAYCRWLTNMERQSGHLTIDQEIAWKPTSMPRATGSPPPRDEKWTAFNCEVAKVPYGRVNIDSIPQGAEVFDGSALLGKTPLNLPKVRAGEFAFEVQFPGFKSEMAKGKLAEGQATSFNLRLRASGAVVFGKAWQNSLGMKFMPLGQAMIAAHETRRSDFAEFVKTTKQPAVPERELDKEPGFPVAYVSRADAAAFCKWLTETERAKGLLEPGQEYRLPSDDEWSMAAYLPRERGDSPSERNLIIGGIFPWGFIWPPLPKPGNFFDKKAEQGSAKGIEGYDDGFAGLAPIGSFRPDSRGLVDLSGNVWEWISEPWGGGDAQTKDFGVARGGAYTTKDRSELLASFRKHLPAGSRLPDVGFRVVLIEDDKPARLEE